jgi:predicted RNase H-like nuclease (RuvC/YqgF family)
MSDLEKRAPCSACEHARHLESCLFVSCDCYVEPLAAYDTLREELAKAQSKNAELQERLDTAERNTREQIADKHRILDEMRAKIVKLVKELYQAKTEWSEALKRNAASLGCAEVGRTSRAAGTNPG